MKRIASVIAIAALAIFSLNSCKEREDNLAGKGGSTVLKVTPQHHGDNIDSCTVYIKYNTQEMPSGNYDEEIKCVMENGKPVATFSNLKKGNYYVYGRGWDPGIERNVIGGIPYTISEDNKTLNINVPVTEEH